MTALRRIAIAAQGYASRSRRGTRREVEAAIRALSCVQLDSITAVERSHRITLGSRVGAYPRETVSRLLGQGRIFEYWAHEACLIPVEDWPLYRPVMESHHPWRGDVIGQDPALADAVRAAIRERGPLASRDFEGQGGGGMWSWKPAKVMLEALWHRGEIVIAGRVSGFQRLYDLAERVIPREMLDAPVPDEAARLRALIIQAVRARGALTEAAVREHWRLKGGVARIEPHADELVREGVLERVGVADGGPPVLIPDAADIDPLRPTAAVLLSPFDNLLWDRPFARRILGFDHLIEVYKPAPERRYGYYVLPFLWRDRIVGRADLKAERSDGSLVVRAFHLEPGVQRSGALDDAFERALDRLRRTVGLDRVVHSGRARTPSYNL
ncbi:MAG: crosslink repair DNA glycosylase YcaQ family protein [Gaiellaceae bacterium]